MKNNTTYCPFSPRNGHIIVTLVQGEQDVIVLPDSANAQRTGDKIVIVAVAADVPTGRYHPGDVIIGLPGQNILALAGTPYGVIHHTAIVAIADDV